MTWRRGCAFTLAGAYARGMPRLPALASLLLASAALLHAPAPAAAFDWAGRVALEAEGLSDPDLDRRLRTVTTLGTLDPVLAEPYLLAALAEPGDDIDDLAKYDLVRIEAARALGRNGSQAVVPYMVEWSADLSVELREVAADVLGAVGGDAATAALVRSLGDVEPDVRLKTVNALGTLGVAGNTKVVIPLITRLEDDKVDVRRRAVEILEALGDRRAVIPLVASIGDSSIDVRKAAVRAVGVLGDAAAVPALTRTLREGTEDLRALAAGALGAIGAVDALPALLELWPSASDALRGKLAMALGAIVARPEASSSAATALTTLVGALAVGSQRGAAREALVTAGAVAVPALISQLGSRKGSDATTIVSILRDAGDARATAALVAEIDRGRVELPLVLEALGATEDPAALLPLLAAAEHKEPTVRVAAMRALGGVIGTDQRAVDVLALRLADPDVEVRTLAAEYLGKVRATIAVTPLVERTRAGEPVAVRRAAIGALGEIGDPAAAPALISIMRDGPGELLRHAADALVTSADDTSLEPLGTLARGQHGLAQAHVVRVIAAIARRTSAPAATKLLTELATKGGSAAAAAAIAGLAASRPDGAVEVLTKLATTAAADRRRLAAWALGALGATAAVPTLVTMLAVQDDKVVADAAWALGEIAVASEAGRAAVLAADGVRKLLKTADDGAWAAGIAATGALVRIAAATPDDALAATFAKPDDAERLLFHRAPLVRANAALLVGELGRSVAPSPSALAGLASVLGGDPSAHARRSAARGLARIAGADPTRVDGARAALLGAASQTVDAELASLATNVGAAAPPPLPARDEWRTFYVVDPALDDKPIAQAPHAVIGSDAIVWATYTDAKGEIVSEQFPAGDAVVFPADAADGY